MAITGAPRVAKGMVLIGSAGAEYFTRGYLAAFDAQSGDTVRAVAFAPAGKFTSAIAEKKIS